MPEVNIKHEIDFKKGNVIVGSFLYPDCPSCERAKNIFKNRGMQYTFIQADKKLFGKVMKETRSQTVPQIFIDGEFVGGEEQLKKRLGIKDVRDQSYGG